MIYSPFGIEVEVKNYCQESGMVEIEYKDGKGGYREFSVVELRADNGIVEIQDAINAAVHGLNN